MPVFNLKDPAARLRLAKELKDPKVLVWILRKHYGENAVIRLRQDWQRDAST